MLYVERNINDGSALCKVCDGSSGEQLLAASLDLLGLDYTCEYSLPGKLFRYDFLVGDNTIIEWDGEQHFKYVNFFHETQENYIHKRNCDREKTKDILDLGCKIIRINHTWGKKSVEELSEHIHLALQSDQKLILSNLDMYQWLFTKDEPCVSI